METYTPTPEEVQKHISAAFDSVNLINQTITKPEEEKGKKAVKRNYQHLEVMMGKDWFSTALTPTQKSDIESAISSGKSYSA